MTTPTDAPSPSGSPLETLEQRSRQLEGMPPARTPSRGGGGDGCLKGCLVGCGCLTVLLVVGVIALLLSAKSAIETYVLSPEPAVLEAPAELGEAEQSAAEVKRERFSRAMERGQPFDGSFTDDEIVYLIQSNPEMQELGGQFRLDFPEEDRFQIRTSFPLPVAFLEGWVNLDAEGSLRVDDGRVQVEVDRFVLRDIEWDPAQRDAVVEGIREQLDLGVMNGLRQIAIAPGEVSIGVDASDGSAPGSAPGSEIEDAVEEPASDPGPAAEAAPAEPPAEELEGGVD